MQSPGTSSARHGIGNRRSFTIVLPDAGPFCRAVGGLDFDQVARRRIGDGDESFWLALQAAEQSPKLFIELLGRLFSFSAELLYDLLKLGRRGAFCM